MDRKVNVMGAEDFKEIGMFFYCTSDDVPSKSKADVLEWLKDAKKITLANESEFEIISIDPMMPQFTDKTAILIKVDTKNIPLDIYPIAATID
jgi:hypothetical protein